MTNPTIKIKPNLKLLNPPKHMSWPPHNKEEEMRKIAWWVWRNEWIPLGRLAPYVLGVCLGSRPRKIKEEEDVPTNRI